MGTTLTAILFAGGRLALCHVGDSRAYLLRDGQLTQITHDDTFVQTLIDDGRITPEEANSHPQRSLLLRALNGQDVEPDLSMREARAGDRYLLCSDGLSGVVSEETLADALANPDPHATADRLIELALRSGGPDNITVIVADVVEDDGRGALLEPVVDGAAGDNIGQRQVDGRSAAGRAALADPAPPPPVTTEQATVSPPPRRRRGLRFALWAVGIVVVLVAAGIGTYVWSLQHWFVGVQGEGAGAQVTVFRGLNTSPFGVNLYRVDEVTDLVLGDLVPATRSNVVDGITAQSAADAARIVRDLHDQQLPVCPVTTGSSTGRTTTGSPTPASPTTEPGAGPTGSATSALPEGDSLTTGAAASSATPSTSTRPMRSSEPGVDCREEK
jgi:protein phosphatase